MISVASEKEAGKKFSGRRKEGKRIRNEKGRIMMKWQAIASLLT